MQNLGFITTIAITFVDEEASRGAFYSNVEFVFVEKKESLFTSTTTTYEYTFNNGSSAGRVEYEVQDGKIVKTEIYKQASSRFSFSDKPILTIAPDGKIQLTGESDVYLCALHSEPSIGMIDPSKLGSNFYLKLRAENWVN